MTDTFVERIEWEVGTKYAALPTNFADLLVRNGYARVMTEAEIEAYTEPPTKGDAA